MTTEKYNKYLNKYNANYKDAFKSESFFEDGVDMKSILMTWKGIGLETNSYHKDNGYIVDLLDEDGNVVGHFKAVPGGMHWEYPELIMQLKKYEKERGLL
jgi:hypothetical protein